MPFEAVAGRIMDNIEREVIVMLELIKVSCSAEEKSHICIPCWGLCLPWGCLPIMACTPGVCSVY